MGQYIIHKDKMSLVCFFVSELYCAAAPSAFFLFCFFSHFSFLFHLMSFSSMACFCTAQCFSASLCISCTVIYSCIFCCQTREFQIHHAVWIISSDLYSSLYTFSIHCFTGIIPDSTHPDECLSCWLSDPVHAILSKIKSRSFTREIQSFSRLFGDRTWWDGLQALAINT